MINDPLAGGIKLSLYNRADKLRKRIASRTAELKITTDHDDKGHFYLYQGQRYPSVTSYLKLLKDEGLMNWKMNQALKYVKDNISLMAEENDWDGEYLDNLIKQA